MPLRNSGKCVLQEDKSCVGNMLTQTSLNSFNFCARIMGVGEGGGRKGAGGIQQLSVQLSLVFNVMFVVTNSYNNTGLYI